MQLGSGMRAIVETMLLVLLRPLLYALEIAENFGVLQSYSFESRDYQVTPGSPWNYALRLRNDSNPSQDLTFLNSELKLGVTPFSLKGSPGKIIAPLILLHSDR